MRWLAQISFHVKSLFLKRKLDAQLAEEIRMHVEMATEANVAAGMKPEEARYAALREFGNVLQVQEQAHDERGWIWLGQVWQDLRYACRQLARAPGFTLVVVLTLALGIGATTAMFSMVNTVILNPVGGPEPERMVQIGERSLVQGKGMFQGATPPLVEELMGQSEAFDGVAWSTWTSLERKTEDFVNLEPGAYVSWNFFAVLNCPPALGRGFREDEAVLVDQGPTKGTAIVLSHAWWQSQWGGDREIIGRTIEMGGLLFTVVGVAPAQFQFPTPSVRYWVPVTRVAIPPRAFAGPNTKVYGRLKAGVTAGQAQVVLGMLAKRLMAAHPETDGYGAMWRWNKQQLVISLRPLSVALQDGGNWAQLRQTLLGLFAAVSFVLLIICANIANLTLGQLERRQHELAVRAAMGAGRGRLMRQLLTENLLLALLGGASGVVVAASGLKLLIALNVMPRLRPVEVDGQLLGVALILSVVTAVFFGLAPMWRGGNVRVQGVLADGGQNATAGRKGGLYRNALVVVQVAVTVVLLTGAGLMLLSVSRVLQVDPGFDSENLLLVEAQLPWRKYDIPNHAEGQKLRLALIRQLHEHFRALPGVQAVGVQQRSFTQSFEWKGQTKSFSAEHASTDAGDGNVFHALRVPLLAGRYFTESDAANPEAVIVNESMAQKFWPGESAVGRKLGGGDLPAFHVIGVVGDAKLYGYLYAALPTMYHPFGAEWNQMLLVAGDGPQFVIRTTGDPEALIPFVRRELKEAEPALRTPSFKVAKQVLYDSTLPQRTYCNYLGAFAGLGLLLSALGIYGVLAFSVARRTREIGIRMAVGADPTEVRAMILRQGGRLIATGIIAGLVGACGLTRFLSSQLYDVSPTDPLVLGVAVLVLLAVALIACWLPARRAAKVDPMIALRAE